MDKIARLFWSVLFSKKNFSVCSNNECDNRFVILVRACLYTLRLERVLCVSFNWFKSLASTTRTRDLEWRGSIQNRQAVVKHPKGTHFIEAWRCAEGIRSP